MNIMKAISMAEGSSDNTIYAAILDIVNRMRRDRSFVHVLDMGCGTGALLSQLQQRFEDLIYFGADYKKLFSDKDFIEFRSADFNSLEENIFDRKMDLIISSEVIEHLENPRDFMRSLQKFLSSKGVVIVSTPNLESFTSQISFFLRGYHSAFGPKNYPAHITPIASYDMKRIAEESGYRIVGTFFIPNGRIPGTSFKWRHFLPFCKGKRFSDNYLMILENQ